jgi:hypothetical protein
MLDNMRFAHQRAGELLAALLADVEAGEVKERAALIDAFKPIQVLRQTAQECARDAANYVHPKLANIQHGSDPDNPMNTVTMPIGHRSSWPFLPRSRNCWIRP